MWSYLKEVMIVITVLLNTSNALSTCDTLGYFPGKRYLSISGSEKYISLYWGSDPAHAASVLFKVVLDRAHGYQGVRLKQGPHSLKDLAANVTFDKSGKYEDAILGLSTGWEPGLDLIRYAGPGATSGLAAPRLEVITANMIPARLRLYAHLPAELWSMKQCKNLTQWSFYAKAELLKTCGFINSVSDETATVYTIQDSSNRATDLSRKLKACAKAFHSLHFKDLDRKGLFQKLQAANESFLFIDYDMWANRSNVILVEEPFCLSHEGPACIPEMDTAIDMRVTDTYILAEYASQLFQLAHIFDPPLEALIFILEQNANGKSIEEAACEWVSENNNTVYEKWVREYEAKKIKHEIAVFYRANGADVNKYDIFLNNLTTEVYRLTKPNIYIILRTYLYYNFTPNYIKSKINYYLEHGIRQKLIGAVVGGDNKMTAAAAVFDEIGVPVLLYDETTADVNSMDSVWLANGHSVHLALAMEYFIRQHNWSRVAVLSDSTYIAKKFLDDLNKCTSGLRNASKLVLRDHRLEQISDTTTVLKELQNENAHIIIVNTHSLAATILRAAAELKMDNEKEYVWIVRERVEYDKIVNLKYFTMSFSCPSKNDISGKYTKSKLLTKMDKLWPRGTWPRSAAVLANAVLTMAKGFENVVQEYPQAREDTHSSQAIRQFGQTLVNLSPIKGFTQDLIYKKHSLVEVIVYLDEWQNGTRKALARFRVNANVKKVNIDHVYQETVFKNGPPHDGTTRCFLSNGDLYLPTCYDSLWITATVLLTVIPFVGILLYRSIRRLLQKIQMKILNEALAQREQRAAKLFNYLVDRKDLKLRRKLGAGRFGRVMLVDLHKPGSKTQVVAAKELRDHQNESEILREACILASLKHDNIIRLIGVCIDNEPTLVLMEVAFFGDLLHYLVDRRYLAESVQCDLLNGIDYEEAAHVSAKELTRLACEAASALAYLALRGVIHRDLRASNCLVDAKRSLKLADFGLARETKTTGLNGSGEYASQRFGLFPVLWMAPESLLYGLFSTASDVYSLGVLLFELVTLGARPYGNIKPPRVMKFVMSGGKPSMPRDASPKTIALAQLCWQREPKKRPTAADIVAYLAEHPYTLSPAFEYEDDQPTDADSGYEESASTEILLPYESLNQDVKSLHEIYERDKEDIMEIRISRSSQSMFALK